MLISFTRDRNNMRHAATIIVALFIGVRVWLFALGCRFDAENLTTWMQIADIQLLRTDLLHTLWYLHSQPPLFDLLIGLALKTGSFPYLLELFYATVTLAGILAFHSLARDLTHRPRLAFLVSAWFCGSPAVLLFSEKLYYDAMVPWLLCLAFYGLHFGLMQRSIWLQTFGFSMLAATILLRSAFHPLIFVIITSIYAVMGRGQRRHLLCACAAPGLAIGLLVLKNALLFGFIGLSSWGPFNIARTTVDRMPSQQRESLIKDGRLSKFSAFESFSAPTRYLKALGPITPTGEPSLDNVRKSTGDFNYNHIVYVKVSKQKSKDALVALTASPASFAKTVVTSLYHFHRPASEFKGLERNLAIISGWDRFANAVIGLQPAAWFGSSLNSTRPTNPLLQISYGAIATTLLFLAGTMAICGDALMGTRQRHLTTTATITLIALATTGVFVILVSSVFDVWENNRAHYDCGPIILLIAIWSATSLLNGRRSQKDQNAAFGAYSNSDGPDRPANPS